MTALWLRRDIKITQMRLLWWMIAAGGMREAFAHGWVGQCAVSMGVSRVSVYRNLKRMEDIGLVRRLSSGRCELVLEVFAAEVCDVPMTRRVT